MRNVIITAFGHAFTTPYPFFVFSFHQCLHVFSAGILYAAFPFAERLTVSDTNGERLVLVVPFRLRKCHFGFRWTGATSTEVQQIGSPACHTCSCRLPERHMSGHVE